MAGPAAAAVPSGPPAAPAAAAPAPAPVLRRGWPYWRDGYAAMLRWELTALRAWLVLLVVVQVLAGVGFVLGIGLFFADVPASAALFVSTGVPVTNLVLVGLVLGPQLVADQRTQGSYDYLRALPVPRSASTAAWFTATLAASLPAVAASLLVAQLRYDLPLRVSPAVVPAVLLTAFTGTMLGYALAHAVPFPMLTRLVTQLLIFVVFGFAPVLFPAGQMPSWLAAANAWLPFAPMADVVRASLTEGVVDGVGAAYAVLGAWAAGATALVAATLGRRG